VSGTANENIHLVYQTLEPIGEGYSGKVAKATLKSSPQQVYAIKSILTSKLNKKARDYFKAELDIVKELDHPNIAKFFECYEDSDAFHLVLEYVPGGDLAKLVEKQPILSEDLIRKFFFQAMYAVNYLHHIGITHRDLKLDNFLLNSTDETTADLKMIDFGFAKKYRTTALNSVVGSPWYIAPEIIAKVKPYTQACDNWSLGVMLYIMLFAEPPFKGRNTEQIFQSVTNSQLNLSDYKHARRSQESRDLLASLLRKDPSQRIPLSEALQSPWFFPIYRDLKFNWGTEIKKKISKKLRKAKLPNRFSQEVVRIMVKLFHDTPEFKEHTKAFFLCDLLCKGMLAQPEIIQLFSEAGMAISETQANQLMDSLLLKTKAVVKCSEFIVAMIDSSFYQDQSRLKLTFDRFDIENRGFLTKDNLRSCFWRFGYDLDDKSINDMVTEFGPDKQDQITFDRFAKVMTKVC
jgi:calcium-dependent protein kinase